VPGGGGGGALLGAHWHHDDWYGPERLRVQAEPILSDQADITGLVNSCVLQLPEGAFWTCTPELHRLMFVGDVHGGTLAFRRSIFEGGVRYPDRNLAEDADFLRAAMPRYRLRRVENDGCFVYMRHGRNAWQFEITGRRSERGWQPCPRPPGFSYERLRAYVEAAKRQLGGPAASTAATVQQPVTPLAPAWADEWKFASEGDPLAQSRWKPLEGGQWSWRGRGAVVKPRSAPWCALSWERCDGRRLRELAGFSIAARIRGSAGAAGFSFGPYRDFLTELGAPGSSKEVRLVVDVRGGSWSFEVDGRRVDRLTLGTPPRDIDDLLSGCFGFKAYEPREVAFEGLRIEASRA
jgi:hypothetical protein